MCHLLLAEANVATFKDTDSNIVAVSGNVAVLISSRGSHIAWRASMQKWLWGHYMLE